MGVWSFLVSLELPGGRAETENCFLPFNSKVGGKDILMTEQRHRNCLSWYLCYAKGIIIIFILINIYCEELYFYNLINK